MNKRYAPSITQSGRLMDIAEPNFDSTDWMSIATQLSRIPRFLGATCRPYSVLEHSILGCVFIQLNQQFDAYSRAAARSFLLHDAHEFILGDFVEPVAVAIPGFRELVDPVKLHIDHAIEDAFNVHLTSEPFKSMIKEVDNLMLQREWIDLMPTEWYGEDYIGAAGKVVPEPIDPHHPHSTVAQMIGQFAHLLRVTA